MALPVGVFSNAYRLVLPQQQRFWSVSLDRPGRPSRRQLEREFGLPVWIEDDEAHLVEEVPGSREISYPTGSKLQLGLFALREALRLRAHGLGWDHWFVMGEFHAVPPDQGETHGPVIVEPKLMARATHEGAAEPEYVLILASGVRWRMAGDLSDPDLAAVAAGESVFRLSGDGPGRGTVARIAGDDLFLAVGRDLREDPVPPVTTRWSPGRRSSTPTWHGQPMRPRRRGSTARCSSRAERSCQTARRTAMP